MTGSSLAWFAAGAAPGAAGSFAATTAGTGFADKVVPAGAGVGAGAGACPSADASADFNADAREKTDDVADSDAGALAGGGAGFGAGAVAGAVATVATGADSAGFTGGGVTGGTGKDAACCCAIGGAAGGETGVSGEATGSTRFEGGESARTSVGRVSRASAVRDCSFNAGVRIRVLKFTLYWLQEVTATGLGAPTAEPCTNSKVAMPDVKFGLSLNFSKLSRFHWPVRTPLFAVPDRKWANFLVRPPITDWPSSRNTPRPEINPFLQTPCHVTVPCDANSFIRFAADSDDHSLQPRESVNTTSPAFASAGLPFAALPAFCLAASAAGTRATRTPTITIHILPDIAIPAAIFRKIRELAQCTDRLARSIQGKSMELPACACAPTGCPCKQRQGRIARRQATFLLHRKHCLADYPIPTPTLEDKQEAALTLRATCTFDCARARRRNGFGRRAA